MIHLRCFLRQFILFHIAHLNRNLNSLLIWGGMMTAFNMRLVWCLLHVTTYTMSYTAHALTQRTSLLSPQSHACAVHCFCFFLYPHIHHQLHHQLHCRINRSSLGTKREIFRLAWQKRTLQLYIFRVYYYKMYICTIISQLLHVF